MANHKQILEQMLRDGTITAQQSGYVQNLLAMYPQHDIAEAIEKAKERFSDDTDDPDANDTLDFENIEELFGTEEILHHSNDEIELSNNTPNDTLFFESIEEIVDPDEMAPPPATSTNHTPQSSSDTLFFENIEEIVDAEDVDLHSSSTSSTSQSAQKTLIPPTDLQSLSKITPEVTYRYTTSESNLIGEGGMGRVIRVFDTHLGRNIAQKELHHHLKGNKSRGGSNIEQRFLREARITAQLEHPGIVPVYEVGEKDDGTLYYTMQELSGRTLEDALKECNSLADRMQLMGHMIDFCQAIGYAHSKNIIHRDIKTENVMIDVHGQTIVLDWGLAKTISDVEYFDSNQISTPMFNDKTSIGVVMGTPSYMSPEQAVGDIHKMDATTDVWSLGIVLFEIITGQLPFSDPNTMMLLEKIRKEDLPDVSDIEPKASKALCAILEKALQKSPADRYQNAALLAQDLEAWYLGGTVSVYDYSWQDKFEKWFVNNRSVALVSLLGVALLMISIVIGTISTAQKNIEVKSERDRAVEAEKSVRISRVRSKLQAIDSKIDKLETDGSYAKAYALKRAYIDVKEKEYARLKLNDDHLDSNDKDIHHLFRLATKVTPSEWIPYDGGEVYTVATNNSSVVVGYSNHEIRNYNLNTGELLWTHTVKGQPIEVRWLNATDLLVLDVERSDVINIQVLNSTGEPKGLQSTLPFPNNGHDHSQLFAVHQQSNSLILYTDGQITSIQLDTGHRTDLFAVSREDIRSFKLSDNERYLAVAHRSTLTIIDIQAPSSPPIVFVHPEQRLDLEVDESTLQDLVWVNEDTIVFRDYMKVWKFSLGTRKGKRILELERNGSQIWNLKGTDFIVTEDYFRTDKLVKLNWKTLETTSFTKEKYNLPNRSQIQSIEEGEWWSYTKEERIILEEINGDTQLQLNQFSSDLITLHHDENDTLMAGNNSGELHIIHYKDRIHPFYPFTYFADTSEFSEFETVEDKEIFGLGSLQDDWYYGITLTHKEPSKLHLFNILTKDQLSIEIDESLYLCHVFNSSIDNQLGLFFSNPCDHASGGGFLNQDVEYGFGYAHIPFPDANIDKLDIDITSFEYDLTESILQSQRMFIQTERVYSDADCLHFANLTDTPLIPVTTCTDETGAPYQKMIHSPDERMVALFNDSGRVAIWDRTKREQLNYTSLDLLRGLHCDAATLSTQKDFNILCSNTLYTFDLNTDSLTHSVEFITDVTHLLTTDDGNISLIESKTRKKFWKLNAQHELEEYNLHQAETFTTISPDNQFVMTKNGQLYHFETMTQLLSLGEHGLLMFSEDSNSIVVTDNNRMRVLPLPDLASFYQTQKTSSPHNLRVCYHSLDVVPVIPFPEDNSPWAPQQLCGTSN